MERLIGSKIPLRAQSDPYNKGFTSLRQGNSNFKIGTSKDKYINPQASQPQITTSKENMTKFSKQLKNHSQAIKANQS